MLESLTREHCENCIDRSRISLVSLARQYIAPDRWLYNPDNRMAGDYSLLAIHAIGRRIDIERYHLDIRGPFLRKDPDIEGEERLLVAIKLQMTDGTFDADAIRSLQTIAQRRKSHFDSFLNQGKNYWTEQAEKAKPFLDQLVHRDPAEPQEKRKRFQRVYWFDQGAFILAKTALASCFGPWFRMCPYGAGFQKVMSPQSDRD